MALLAPATIPEQRPVAVTSRVILRLVPDLPEGSTRTHRAGFAAVLSMLLVGGLLSLLGLNLILARNAFTLHDLRQESRTLSHVEQALSAHLSRVQSPQELALRAAALGMRPSEKVTFVRLTTESTTASKHGEARP